MSHTASHTASALGQVAVDPAPPDPATLDLLPDPTVVVAPDGTVAAANGLAIRLVGGARVVGRPARDAFPLRTEGGTDWWSGAAPLDGDPCLLARVPETPLRLVASRAERPVMLTARRVPAAGGALSWLVLSLRRAERRERLDAARSDLVSTVSHELRSPLTSVKGFTKTLLAKWDRFNDEQRLAMLRTVNADADRVTRLLGELLDVSRIDAGRLQLRRQMVAVPGVVWDVVARLEVLAEGRTVAAALAGELPSLYADPDKVAQVFTNLVENAVKYGEGAISVGATLHEDTVEFVVSDQGTGIPEGFLPHVFGKFARRQGERRSGTGLGLYICKGIVEAHGGRMWAESPQGQGASFHFTLPRGGLELAGIVVSAPSSGVSGVNP